MKRKELPPPNLLERAIAAVSPGWALNRHKSRAAMALTGGYAGAGYSERMAAWQPGVGDADANTTRDLRELRARSRDLVRNAPIAGGAIETQVTNVVGTGLMLQPRVDARLLGISDEQARQWQADVQSRWSVWCESELADAEGELNFYELQELAFRSRLESGDSFVVLAKKSRPMWPYQLALQVIEADRVSNPNYGVDTDKLTQGIERDDSGHPVAVHISNRHPGRNISAKSVTWTRLPMRGERTGRRNVIHLKRKLRPGQTRGIPELAPIIATLKQLDRYSQAEVDAAVNSAAVALFAKMDPDTFGDLFDDSAKSQYMDRAQSWDGTVQSGKVINLLPGEDITNPVQNRPNPNFDPFVQAVMRQIGIGLNIPHEVLMKHFQASYSAARAALLDAWRTWRTRRTWLAGKLCQPVYEEWLADEVAAGRVIAPGFFADPLMRAAWCGSSWSGDGPGSIDPEKEVNAAEKRVAMGMTTLEEEIIAYDGGDWETKHRQRVEEQQARERDGLAAPVDMQPGSPGAAPGRQQNVPPQE